MTARLKKQIAELQRELARIDVSTRPNNTNNNTPSKSTKRRMRRGRPGRNMGAASTASGFGAAQAQKVNPRMPLTRVSTAYGAGAIRVARNEMLTAVKATANKTLSLHNFPWLIGLAKSFDKVVWHKCELEFKSGAASTTAGLVAYGLDWDHSSSYVMSRQSVLSLTPVNDHPVWQCGKLVLPSSRLMSRSSYTIAYTDNIEKEFGHSNCSPGFACWSSTAAAEVGELWISYDLTLFGTSMV